MGNLIAGCIKLQVSALGVGSLDPQFAKRCSSCGARQYTTSSTCRFCGGAVQVAVRSSRDAEHHRHHHFIGSHSNNSNSANPAAAAIPIVFAVDPATGTVVRYIVDGRGNLIRVGGTVSGRLVNSDHPGPILLNINPSVHHDGADEHDEEQPLPDVDDVNMDTVISSAVKLADLVDPDRRLATAVPAADAAASAGSPVEESDQQHQKGCRDKLTEDKSIIVSQALNDARESITCPVCLSEYSSPVVTLPCGHSLCGCHLPDIGTGAGRCPICRGEIPKRLLRSRKEGDMEEDTNINADLEKYVEAIQTLAAEAERKEQGRGGRGKTCGSCSDAAEIPAAKGKRHGRKLGLRRRRKR